MKLWRMTVAILFCGLILALAVCGCDKVAVSQADRQRISQSIADYVINDLCYIKDPRTGLCYAYYWGGASNGGPALAQVPENMIPPDMLIVANTGGKK